MSRISIFKSFGFFRTPFGSVVMLLSRVLRFARPLDLRAGRIERFSQLFQAHHDTPGSDDLPGSIGVGRDDCLRCTFRAVPCRESVSWRRVFPFSQRLKDRPERNPHMTRVLRAKLFDREIIQRRPSWQYLFVCLFLKTTKIASPAGIVQCGATGGSPFRTKIFLHFYL